MSSHGNGRGRNTPLHRRRVPESFSQRAAQTNPLPELSPEQLEAEQRRQHIDLRVIRKVAIDSPSGAVARWENYITYFSSDMYHVGIGRSMGALALTHIESRDMNNLLREHYPRDYSDPKRKQRLFRGVRSGLEYLIDEKASEYRAEALLKTAALRAGASLSPEDRRRHWQHIPPELAEESKGARADTKQLAITPLESVLMNEYAFGPLSAIVERPDLWGSGRMVLDCTTDSVLRQEHTEIVNHLAREEGLRGVYKLSGPWQAHVTFFRYFKHVDPEMAGANTSAYDLPETVPLTPPSVNCYNLIDGRATRV